MTANTVRLAVGDAAPDFTLRTESDIEWRLFERIGNVVVLLFYPQNETLVCTKQLCSVRDNWSKYLETNADIIGISPGTPDEHRTFSSNRQLPIQLLADPERRVTQIFGKHRIWPINFTRAVVVIDAHGLIRNRDVMLRALRPRDEDVITDIYAARGDALQERYAGLRQRLRSLVR